MLKKIFISIIFTIFLLEFFSFIATKLNLLIVNSDPDYIHSYGNKWRTEELKGRRADGIRQKREATRLL